VPTTDTNVTPVRDGLLALVQLDEGNQVRLALHGELDLSNVPTLDAALNEALATGKKILIDMDRLEFLDSTGIALLIASLGRTDAERLSFLPSRSTAVRRVLSLTGLEQRMAISTTAEPGPPLTA
jgi:anti-sigma B factor antagonist